MRTEVLVVLGLVAAYLIQGFAEVAWGPLDAWQVDESYRRWSGFALTLCILAQVVLALARKTAAADRSRLYRRIHRLLGVGALLGLFLHSSSPGHGLLLGLGVLLPAQVALGVLSPVEGDRRRWRIAHTLLACLLVGGVALHIWMVFAWS